MKENDDEVMRAFEISYAKWGVGTFEHNEFGNGYADEKTQEAFVDYYGGWMDCIATRKADCHEELWQPIATLSPAYWQCNACGNSEVREREVTCWVCGHGQMIFKGTKPPYTYHGGQFLGWDADVGHYVAEFFIGKGFVYAWNQEPCRPTKWASLTRATNHQGDGK